MARMSDKAIDDAGRVDHSETDGLSYPVLVVMMVVLHAAAHGTGFGLHFDGLLRAC